MNIKPLFDRVVIKPIPQKQKSSSGLILPETSSERPACAKVICVGDGGETDGKPNKIYVNVGDIVLYTKYGGVEFKIDNEDLIVLRQTDILAILEGDYTND